MMPLSSLIFEVLGLHMETNCKVCAKRRWKERLIYLFLFISSNLKSVEIKVFLLTSQIDNCMELLNRYFNFY